MTTKQRLTLVIGFAGCLVGAVAIWRFLSQQPSAPALPDGPGVTRLYETREWTTSDLSATPEGDDGLDFENSLVVVLAEAGVRDIEGLATALNSTIESYTFEHIDEFVEWQNANGIVPVERWEQDPDRFQSAWDTLRATFVFAEINAADARVIRRKRDTDRTGEADAQVKSKTRPAGRPFLTEYRGSLEIYEVVLPGTYPTLDGDFAETELGIEMTKRPDTGDWVITGIHHYADEIPPPRIAIPPL